MGPHGYLSSIFKRVTSDQKVVIDGANALVTTGSADANGNEIDAPFDFEYDPDGKKFGAERHFCRTRRRPDPPRDTFNKDDDILGAGTVFL